MNDLFSTRLLFCRLLRFVSIVLSPLSAITIVAAWLAIATRLLSAIVSAIALSAIVATFTLRLTAFVVAVVASALAVSALRLFGFRRIAIAWVAVAAFVATTLSAFLLFGIVETRQAVLAQNVTKGTALLFFVATAVKVVGLNTVLIESNYFKRTFC